MLASSSTSSFSRPVAIAPTSDAFALASTSSILLRAPRTHRRWHTSSSEPTCDLNCAWRFRAAGPVGGRVVRVGASSAWGTPEEQPATTSLTPGQADGSGQISSQAGLGSWTEQGRGSSSGGGSSAGASTNGSSGNLALGSSQSAESIAGSQQSISGIKKKQEYPGLPTVPWGTGKIVQVMVLWLLAYIIIGQVAVPVGLSLLGLDRDALSVRGHAVLHLCLDLSQLGFTLGILWHCLKQYKPLARGFFPMRWAGAWPLVVLAACAVFPAVDWIAQQSMSWFPVDADSWASHMEASLSVGDWVTNVAYFSVVSICAPIWEEAIFRGFLLTSLARYMSPPAAVAASSLLFAMCHFRLQTFLPLLALGIVFSAVFLLTRNLLPPMVLHSAWNVFVLANLLLRPG